jgi:hypothetical protein
MRPGDAEHLISSTLMSPAKSVERLGPQFDPARRGVGDGAVSLVYIRWNRR